ncbi:hypothetical protein DL96DRAFT_1551201 [Flagelloscypha sp. PMI_526]|nr:hypothetical protein DL96DRAFT_1551201 [Flagelloscypha sp. PMI_526]
MVKEMMNRVQVDCQLSSSPRVCDYFDMICGSGFGGILAIMCGILSMTGDQLVREFVNLCTAVFAERLDMPKRTAVLEQEMKGMIANIGHPRLFRNYRTRANHSFDCMLWEAACATTSMPDFFSPIVIGDMGIGETFVAGDLRWNNPTDELTKEATDVFKGCRICTILNIGSGHSEAMSLSKGLTDLFPRIALDCERVADDMERRFCNTPEVFWRLNVEQGLQSPAIDLSNLNAVISHTHSIFRALGRHDLIRRPERIIVDGISGVVPAVVQTLHRKLYPPPTQNFTGRRCELEKLEDYFSLSRESTLCRVGVLYGIGGGGKSQIGLEFIRRSQNRFTDVFFVDASNKFTLENDLKLIAIEVSDKPTVEDALHLLRTTKEEWLLFLDNADDPSLDLRPYIMWPHGNVLITTRNRELELDDAVELQLRGVAAEKTVETYQLASEIVQTLGCLALAVNQACGFLAQDICTLSEYLPIYLRNRKRLLEDKSIQTTDDYEHTVYTTWTISFNKLSSPAVRLLELLCFMHHEGIPSRIFEDAWAVYKTAYKDAIPSCLATFLSSFHAVDSTWDILRFRTLIKEIRSFSLMEFNTSSRTVSLHPLVQQWAQSQCLRPKEIICSTQTLLSIATPRGGSNDEFTRTLSLVPHIRASTQTGLDVHFTLLHHFGLAFDRGGMFQESAAVYEQEKVKMQEAFGVEHPVTLRVMNHLASAYSELGRHRDALELHKQVLEIKSRTLGDEHPESLTGMINLAYAYSDLGLYRDALKLNQHVLILAIRKQMQGEAHPDILTCMNNLASAYSGLAQHRDALEVQKQVLALSTQILENDHPFTLISTSNLATSYSALGRHKDALKLNEHVLALRTQILGDEHPETLTSMSNLALTYSHLGRYNDSLKLAERVLALRTQILGQEHLDTLTSMNNLASIYPYLGQHTDALKMKEQVLDLRTRILGKKHPDTLKSMNNLVFTYSDLGRHRDALKLQLEALVLSAQYLGEEHPDTLWGMGNLARICSDLGLHGDALKIRQKVLALRTSIFGEKHPHTLTIMNSLASTYSDLGQHREALKMKEQVLALRKQVLGEDHPDTLTSMSNLAATYSYICQHRNALELHEQTLNMRTRVLGQEHPDTISSFEQHIINFAGNLFDQSGVAKVERKFGRQAVETPHTPSKMREATEAV